MSSTEWGELGVTGSIGLPTGTVTLLLADVEGSTRLWQNHSDEMTEAVAALDRTLAEVTAKHNGVRPVEQGEGDSFVIAFACASDAVACALDLQRAALGPIRLRIGLHTGEIRLRDEGNYIGPTINRTARLRDLAHGGQTVLTAITEELVLDSLPDDAWTVDLGSHSLRDLPRPERVMQLCHRELTNQFPPLRSQNDVVAQHLPVQLTSFVGRSRQLAEVRRLVVENRLVTLTGAGGIGKTRLAVQFAATAAGEFDGGARYVDLAPIIDPDLVPLAVARALGLPDQPGRSTMDTIIRAVGARQMLMVLDNCEHLLDPSANLITALTSSCPGLTILTTSREPIGVAGEWTWRVPSLSLADEAVELFADRARLATRDFRVTADNLAVVTEICQRLDGMPLAIELAAARVRALSLDELKDSLHDRFRLLTGGSRTAVRRQQTLRASVDWSHALLSESESVLFRRLATFAGGFDLRAVQMVTGSGNAERYQVLDQLSLLVDKSLVVAESDRGHTRYRLLETVRQYAAEKLTESGEAADIRTRHRGHYAALATELDNPSAGRHEQLLEQAVTDIDNLRTAFAWSRDCGDIEAAMHLASALLPLWLARGRVVEGLSWFERLLDDRAANEADVAPAVHARALADKALLDAWGIASDRRDQAERALELAREVGDPALIARALTACGSIAAYDADVARPYLAEAGELARALGDKWRLSQVLGWHTYAAFFAGDPGAAEASGTEGRRVADAIGDRSSSRFCRIWGAATPLILRGALAEAAIIATEVLDEAYAASDVHSRYLALQQLCYLDAHRGDTATASVHARALMEAGAELGGFLGGCGCMLAGWVAMSAGDVAAAEELYEMAWPQVTAVPSACAVFFAWRADAALASGRLGEARRWADAGVTATKGSHLATALLTRCRVELEHGDVERAERDGHDALAIFGGAGAQLHFAEALECLGRIGALGGFHRESARMFGAATAHWQRLGAVRFRIHQAGVDASIAALREVMGEAAFEDAWAEGAALSIQEAVAYVQRGRGERKRPSSGWAALTPTELDVVRLVGEGLGNKDIGARLFVSPRTVQTHLTHVYAKLGLNSRVQLAQQATSRAQPAR